jgi:hypothetical protein
MNRSTLRAFSLSFLVMLSCPLWSSRAQADETAQAKAHFKAAEIHFSLGEFKPALEEYRKAYQLRPLPALLFNMAQCHRHLGELERAAFLIRRFLETSSSETQQHQAEVVLQQVEAALQKKQKEKPEAAPSPGVRPGSSVSGISVPSSSSLPIAAKRSSSFSRSIAAPAFAAAAGITREPSSTAASITQPVVAPPPLYTRWWFWTLVGTVVVGTAASVGVAATRGEDPPSGTLAPVDYR